MKKVIDISGKIYNGIRVIERDFGKELENKNTKNNKIFWKCQCHCGNYFTTSGSNLKSGNTKSCGCQIKITMSLVGKNNSKQNKWKFKDNIAIGYTFKNEEFIIDIEDYDKVKYYCWRMSENGYIVANNKDTTNTMIRIHRIIMNARKGEYVDHKNWDKSNNWKRNLRLCTKSQNNVNIKRKINNTSGYTGVKQDSNGKWKSQISYNNERIHLGTFDKLEDAVYIRHQAESIMHNEFNGEINRKDFINIIKNRLINKVNQ